MITDAGRFAQRSDLKWPETLIIRCCPALERIGRMPGTGVAAAEHPSRHVVSALAQLLLQSAPRSASKRSWSCDPMAGEGCPHSAGSEFPADATRCVSSSDCQVDTEEGRTMTRRWAAAVISVVLGAVIAGCSNDSADPVTVAASASSRPTPTPSVAAISTAPPTSSAPPAVSSTVTSASLDLSTSSAWPTTLSPAQTADAKAALDVYARYQVLVGVAGADPGKDWTAQISAVATAVAESQFVEALTQTAVRGQRTTGSSQISPVVTSTQPSLTGLRPSPTRRVALT